MARSLKKRRNQPPAPTPESRTERRTLVRLQHSSWEGPLPPPIIIEEFDRIVPGAAARILDEWEAEAAHRRAFERRAVVIEGLERIGGRILAFAFAVAALGVAVYLASIGAEWASGLIGTGTIASVVASLVYIRRK